MKNSINYIYNNNIFISNNSLNLNKFTWSNGSVYELHAIEFFFNQIKNEKDFTIVDIGAQSGAFCLLAKFCNNTKWYSFEPDPDNYQCLIENLRLNDINNIVPNQIAIDKEIKKTKFNICKSHRGLNTIGDNLKTFSKEDSY